MTPISGNTRTNVSRWEREQMVPAARPARKIHTELAPHASAASVTRLSNRPSESALAKRLDEFLRQSSATYQVDGRPVRVTAAFRTRYGETDKQTQAWVKKFETFVGPANYQKIAMQANRAMSSRGTPEDIRVATQALIDAGAVQEELAKNPGSSPERAVQSVMNEYRIGLDCRGYVYRAFLHARGTGSTPAKGSAYFDRDQGFAVFQEMPSRFRKIEVSAARTGDIFRLAPGDDDRDHNLIVRSNELRDLPRGGKVTVSGRDVPERFVNDGWPSGTTPRVRVITVDSSWGDTGPKREVWLYNERTKTWGEWDSDGNFRESTKGPYNHEVDGVYRSRKES